ncbi:hypothetical protein A0H81_03277 [Grifola frondosa]|uniref:Uncharacterized protein n=1 Tax=Grifola frondosa TaxID=5627 RepID=A0A1C7MGY9_GRIFR|nr:hypothetical protein A0H81_03277 [Grifola frondosa]
MVSTSRCRSCQFRPLDCIHHPLSKTVSPLFELRTTNQAVSCVRWTASIAAFYAILTSSPPVLISGTSKSHKSLSHVEATIRNNINITVKSPPECL